ncbi:MAG: hypothetical protein ABI960_07975 [Candidatus Eisenbacteria bacterium]
MRAVRLLSLALFLVMGFAGAASAQYNNTPGTYNVKVGVVPALLPAGSLPDVGTLGPDLFEGVLTITGGAGGYSAQFQGQRSDGAKLNVGATFDGSWIGFKLGSIVVGSSLESDCITGIDGSHLISANINGVGTVDGAIHRVIAKFSAGPTLGMFKVLKAPGNLR